MEFICDTLRQFPVLQDLSHDQDIYILCEVQSGHPDTLEVLIVSATLNITYMFCPSWYLPGGTHFLVYNSTYEGISQSSSCKIN